MHRQSGTIVDLGQKLLLRVAAGILVTVGAIVFASAEQGLEGNSNPTPAQIKADVVLNLPRYVEWPEGAFLLTNSPVLLGVYGNSPLLSELKKQAKIKRVNGREVIVRQFFWPLEPNCHVLLISNTEKTRVGNILRKVQHATVLTVSDTENFVARGGMIQFGLRDQKAQFAVNLAAATNAQLKVSARLLNVASNVQ